MKHENCYICLSVRKISYNRVLFRDSNRITEFLNKWRKHCVNSVIDQHFKLRAIPYAERWCMWARSQQLPSFVDGFFQASW